jgi:dTDP-4-amino-4,6-dideoxygalactose transaminase
MTTSPPAVPPLDLAAELADLRPAIEAALARVLDTGQFVLGPEVEAFEAEAAAYLGVRHAVALNSGTDALLIALRALGVGPGDEVVTTPFSFFATSEVVQVLGATPVFVDLEREGFGLDPDLVERAISERTKAILPVHLYGAAAAMGRLIEVAARHRLPLVEDAAQAFGARYAASCAGCDGGCDRDALAGRALGTLGTVGAYSFYPTKNLGAYGDGGLLVSDDEALTAAARRLRNHGSTRRYEHEQVGYNSRLDAFQAAVLRVKLPHLDRWTAERRALAARYDRLLAGVPGLVTPVPAPGHVYHQYTVLLPAPLRDLVAQACRDAGVATTVYYPTTLDRYGGRTVGSLERARDAAARVLSLPLYPTLGEARQDRVVEVVVGALAAAIAGTT